MAFEGGFEKRLRSNPVKGDRGEKDQYVFKESPGVQPAQRYGRENRLDLYFPRP